MLKTIIRTILVLGIFLAACGKTRIAWQPPILPIKLVFSEEGVNLELEVGVDIPYIGRVSLAADLGEIKTEFPTLFVQLNDEVYEYDLTPQGGKKFDAIICESSCRIGIELLDNGNMILDVQAYSSTKEPCLIPNPNNFQPMLAVNEDALNVRSGPGVTYNRIAVVSRGEILESDGTTRNASDGGVWYRVLVPAGNVHEGEEGWVNARCVLNR